MVEGAVVTFWNFLKADKEKTSKTLDVLWRQPKQMDSTDLALVKAIKTCLNKVSLIARRELGRTIY
jgi:hypothetical protein